MSVPTEHWKLGLFVVVALALLAASVVFLGAFHLGRDTVPFYAYFNESVSGLDVGAPAQLRGVTIGQVSSIDVAPDNRHVKATFVVAESKVKQLGWSSIPKDLRVQVTSRGVTGVKFLLLDYLDPETHPAPELPFSTPPHTIPSTPSTMESVKDAVLKLARDLPRASNQVASVLARMGDVLENLQQSELPERAASALEQTQATLSTLDRKLGELPVAEFSRQSQRTLQDLSTTLERIDATLADTQGVLARLDGDRGLLSSIKRTSDVIGSVALRADSSGDELSQTLRGVRDLTEELRRFIDVLERDPDMLLKGRAAAP